MRAVEVGAKEWHEEQMKLRTRRDAMRAQAERTDPRDLLSRARADNVDIKMDHGRDKDRGTFGTVTMLQLATDSFQASLISWTTIIDLLAIYIRNVYSL